MKTPDATPAESTTSDRFQPLLPEEMRHTTDGSVDWLWHGYIARRNVTLLTSLWKAGKTTLLSVLLSRLATGGELAGRPVRPARTLYISEEDRSLWVARDAELGFRGRARFLCREFAGRPTPKDWRDLVDSLELRANRSEFDLVVIDSLAHVNPGSENDAAAMTELVKSLQGLAGRGVAVLVLHHPRKAAAAAGRAARGSGALPAAADITIEMDWVDGPAEGDRRRLLRGFSRHAATPLRLAIEWTADGRDYHALGESALDDFDGGWPVLEGVLEDAYQKLTRRGILKAWPQDHPKPSPITLWRWLDRAVKDGRVQRDGRGRCREPFRFWLTGQEQRWANDPNHLPDLPEFDDFDVIRAAGNVIRHSAQIDEERRQKRERKKKKKAAEAPPPDEFEDETDDDKPCYPFGEEARWIERGLG
jgi:hypothetical protein